MSSVRRRLGVDSWNWHHETWFSEGSQDGREAVGTDDQIDPPATTVLPKLPRTFNINSYTALAWRGKIEFCCASCRQAFSPPPDVTMQRPNLIQCLPIHTHEP
jgi:hypothetical protein